jgi:hypothetical protein
MWVLILCIYVIPLVGSSILARRNIRSGRVDMRGALVVGTGTAIFYMLNYLLTVNVGELGALRVLMGMTVEAPLGHSLVHGVVMFLAYLAIEPYIRRLWPAVLVSWARFVSGRVRDPIVGRDILVGSAMGLFMILSDQLYHHLARRLGLTDEAAVLPFRTLGVMIGPRSMLAALSVNLAVGILRATTFFTLLVVSRFILRNNRAAATALTILFALMFVQYGAKTTWLEVGVSVLTSAVVVVLALRFGFLASIVALSTGFMFSDFPWTTDLATWFAPQTLLAWGIVGLALAYGFLIAVRGHSLFQDPLSDPVAKRVRLGE